MGRKKTGGRDFKPGNPGGPGRPPLSKEVQALRKMNRDMLAEILDEFGNFDLEKLQKAAANPKLTTYQRMLLKAYEKSLKGDLQAMQLILDRTAGKPKDTVEHTGGITYIVEDYRDDDD